MEPSALITLARGGKSRKEGAKSEARTRPETSEIGLQLKLRLRDGCIAMWGRGQPDQEGSGKRQRYFCRGVFV